MYDLNLVMVNCALVKAIKLTMATRALIGKGRQGYEDCFDIEREIRGAAGECQRVLELIKADNDRPLVGG